MGQAPGVVVCLEEEEAAALPGWLTRSFEQPAPAVLSGPAVGSAGTARAPRCRPPPRLLPAAACRTQTLPPPTAAALRCRPPLPPPTAAAPQAPRGRGRGPAAPGPGRCCSIASVYNLNI